MLYVPHILDTEGVGWLGPQAWFNHSKPGSQIRTLYGIVCTLADIILNN